MRLIGPCLVVALWVLALAAGCSGGGSGGIGGAGGSGGIGGTGGSADAGSATDGAVLTPPTNPIALCVDLQNLSCAIQFNCTPPDMRDALFTQLWGTSLQECLEANPVVCAGDRCDSPMVYDATAATQCVDETSAYTCADVAKSYPDVCSSACRSSTGGAGG